MAVTVPARRARVFGLAAALMVAITVLAAALAHAQGTSTGRVPLPLETVLPDLERLPPDIRAIRERGYLIVAMTAQDRYPFYYTNDDGQLTGFEVDMARDIARHLGVDEVVFDRTPPTFNAVIEYVNEGKADIGLSKLSISLPRAQQVLFTRPYLILPQTILANRVALAAARAGSNALQVLQLPGMRIGVIEGTVYVEYGRNLFPNAELVLYDSPEELFNAVINAEVVATAYDQAMTSGLLHQRPELVIYLQEQIIPGIVDPLAIAVPWQSVWLRDWLNTYLDLRNEQWTVQQLFQLYPLPSAGVY